MRWTWTLFLIAGFSPLQETADAPYAWARFKPGTVKKSRMSTYGTWVIEYTHTLKEITDKEVVFDVATKNLKSGETKNEVLKIPVIRLEPVPGAEETLAFNGKDHKCRVMKGTYELAGMKVEVKHWMTEGISFPLKTLEVAKGEQSWMNLETESILVTLEAEQVVGGRKLKCAQYRATVKGEQGGTATTWMSSSMPGGLVRSETEIGPGPSKMKMVQETTHFEAKN